MFARGSSSYSEQVQRALFFAHHEAVLLGSVAVEPEHLLLGVVRECSTFFVRLIGESVAQPIRQELLSKLVPQTPVRTKLPFSNKSKAVLACAHREAKHGGYKRVEAGHIILGLLQESVVAAQVLNTRGVTPDSVRKARKR